MVEAFGASAGDSWADYVIVGAGSAGCVLANRLTANGRLNVALLEAGGDDRMSRNLLDPAAAASTMNIRIPAGFTRMLKDGRVNWNYTTEADPGTAGRRHHFARGKVLGGSSSINGMLWVRGLPEDYDRWGQLGLTGWNWNEAQRYFERIERQHGAAAGNEGGGQLDIADLPMKHPMFERMTRAFEEAGAPATHDLNGTTREGVAQVRVNIHKGRRVSSATAYLHPIMSRQNLRVITHAHASRVIFQGGRAVGVEYLRGNVRQVIRARREVILSGGTINSPQLLELSGIGAAKRLRDLGIPIMVNSPRVGENLQDHYASMVRARLKPGTPSLNELSRGIPLLGQIARFTLTGTGLLALGGSNLTAFLKSDPVLDLPDLQFFASPATVDFEALAKHGQMTMETQPGVTVGGYVMRPYSSGSIHITNADFREQPAIRPNFLSHEADCRAQVAGLRLARRVLGAPALASVVDHELTPGANLQTDEELLAFARASGSTGYHQTSTCAMGAGPDSVVSANLKVVGIDGLRVVDASIMPFVVSGNTNAATMMIAEKAADMILAEAL